MHENLRIDLFAQDRRKWLALMRRRATKRPRIAVPGGALGAEGRGKRCRTGEGTCAVPPTAVGLVQF